MVASVNTEREFVAMETTASPRAVRGAAPDLAESPSSFATIAEDRLEGAFAIGRFIDPT